MGGGRSWDLRDGVGGTHATLFRLDQARGGRRALTILFPHIPGIQGPRFRSPRGLHRENTPLRCLAITLGRLVSI